MIRHNERILSANVPETAFSLSKGPLWTDEQRDTLGNGFTRKPGTGERHRGVIILGAVPPPMGGAAKNTKIVLDALSRHCDVALLNTSVGQLSHARTLSYHARRVYRVLGVCVGIVKFRAAGFRKLYMVPDGGYGSVYTLLYVLLAKAGGMKVYLHHRTYQYIDSFNPVLSVILLVGGFRLHHIFLSDGMREGFEKQYGGDLVASLSSNARHVKIFQESKVTVRQGITLGHLSNLCEEKGVFLAIETFEAIAEVRDDVRFYIAGNPVTDAVKKRLDAYKCKWGGRLRLFGHLEGDEKDRFYRDVHFFLFPTLFKQEAQPNVLYEAMSHGCVCISYRRSCIPEMIDSDCGLLLDTDTEFSVGATKFVRDIVDAGLFEAYSRASVEKLRVQKQNSDVQFLNLIQRLSSDM